MDSLTRSTDDKMLAGVIGGIADHYDMDPTTLRLVFAALVLFTFFIPMAILYLAAIFIIPEE